MKNKDLLTDLEQITFIAKHLKYNLPVGVTASDIEITCGGFSLTLDSITGEERPTDLSPVKDKILGGNHGE